MEAGQRLRHLGLEEEMGPLRTTLDVGEAQALLTLLDELYAAAHPQSLIDVTAENAFAWDERDTLAHPRTRAVYKLFRVAGRIVPTKLVVEEESQALREHRGRLE